MNKATVVFIAIVLVAGGLIWWKVGGRSSAPANETATPETAATDEAAAATVTYSATGFSPATLTVAVGQSVNFVNQSTGTLWVASDPHPTHTGLPGLNSGRAVATGSQYSFTFQQAGRFGYHNHLNPAQRGTIVVK